MDILSSFGIDQDKFFLGGICKRGHDFQETGKTLRKKIDNTCPECNSIRSRKYREQNRDRINEKQRVEKYKRYHSDPEFAERIRKYCRDYYHKNHAECRRKNFEYAEQNRERLREYARQYRANNPEKVKAGKRQYAVENPLKIKELRNRRKHRKKQVVHVPYTKQQYSDRLGQFNNACAYCGSDDNLVLDHFIPIKSGGSDVISNLIPSCWACNCSKQARDPKAWYQSMPFYSAKRWKSILKVLGKTDVNYNQIPLI